MNEGPFIFAQHHAAQGALLEDIEDVDGQFLVAAQREGGRVHDLEPPLEHLLFMASLEQVGSAQRYGETHVYLFHRDETELALRMIVQY